MNIANHNKVQNNSMSPKPVSDLVRLAALSVLAGAACFNVGCAHSVTATPAKPAQAAPAAVSHKDAPVAQTDTVAMLSEDDGAIDDSPATETPADQAPSPSTPAESSPAKAAPSDENPVVEAPAESAPAKAAPLGDQPVVQAPAKAAPSVQAPVAQAPAESAPSQVAPPDKKPVVEAAADPTPVEAAPSDEKPDIEPAEQTTAADPTVVADVPEPKAVEPKATAPVTPDVPVAQPSTPDVKSPAPSTPDVKTPVVTTTAPKATEPATPDVKTPDAKTQPVAVAQAAVAAKPADQGMVTGGIDADGNINLMVNRSAVITTRVPYSKVHVAAPDVAEPVLLDGAKQILLNAKKPGSTEMMIWDADGHSQIVNIIVGFDLRGLDSQLKEMFPKAQIKVDIANGVIVLRGHAPDLLTAQQAAQVATPYGVASASASAGGAAGNAVLNFLEISGGQQVILQVRFAEVTRTIQQSLGFNAFASDGKFGVGAGNGTAGTPLTLGGTGNATALANTTGSAFPLYGGASIGNTSFEYFITALRQNGLLRILAEPNLTAVSGQQASFLAGGEIPILVPQASGGGSVTTVDYKQYGIQLNFTPTVLGDGRIRLLCSPQVSDLDYAHAVNLGGEPVPALTTRNVNTTVELAEGQTFALAGLLKNEITATKSITPVIGDMPVIGALFRSVSYNRQETELVILVTPHLVEALNPNQVPAVPGEIWRDPTEAQLFWNGDLGGTAPDTRHAPLVRSSRFYGFTGYAPATTTAK